MEFQQRRKKSDKSKGNFEKYGKGSARGARIKLATQSSISDLEKTVPKKR